MRPLLSSMEWAAAEAAALISAAQQQQGSAAPDHCKCKCIHPQCVRDMDSPRDEYLYSPTAANGQGQGHSKSKGGWDAVAPKRADQAHPHSQQQQQPQCSPHTHQQQQQQQQRSSASDAWPGPHLPLTQVQHQLVCAATGSCADPRHPPETVIDGRSDTFWATTGLLPQCLLLQLRRAVVVSSIEVHCKGVAALSVSLSHVRTQHCRALTGRRGSSDAQQSSLRFPRSAQQPRGGWSCGTVLFKPVLPVTDDVLPRGNAAGINSSFLTSHVCLVIEASHQDDGICLVSRVIVSTQA
ncbi:hypothetical protein JKP88DRAFT_250858 [Tribonema minus]|uniref:Uncharacterized protein n=1 Tax=Tribonema minus TaxID=303371 RepID=A0A835ZK32_9STRA|nr:hypothetical protein JKP88DRAFT_250858 [Tribonema minus]